MKSTISAVEAGVQVLKEVSSSSVEVMIALLQTELWWNIRGVP